MHLSCDFPRFEIGNPAKLIIFNAVFVIVNIEKSIHVISHWDNLEQRVVSGTLFLQMATSCFPNSYCKLLLTC